MRKIKLLVVVILTLTIASCEDESGEYARRIFKNSELNTAYKDCLKVSLDTAKAHLFVENGFYDYHDEAYRIELPTSAHFIVDTLNHHGQGDSITSLILKMNRAAEHCGDKVKIAFGASITNLNFSNYTALLNGPNNAITSYFKTNSYASLSEILNVTVQSELQSTGAIILWNQVLNSYYQYNPQAVSIDLTRSVTEQMLNGVFAEMEIEEIKIRTIPEYRVTKALDTVFAVLDK
ncbi:MAG: DUF4197 domain-containing protein [Bacteroidales bacterium]